MARGLLPIFMAFVAALTFAAAAMAQPAPRGTLVAVMATELTVLDPVFTTAAITRTHGFMVYDQLFALDSKGVPRPQMVETWDSAADGLRWSFTLRPGLAFHDGAPVRAVDAVASIRRWAGRDTTGRALLAAGMSLAAIDDKTFTLTLQQPFAPVLNALAKASANALFVLPERLAVAEGTQRVTDPTGSGPFMFKADEWRPGDRIVYVRNPRYVPRAEPPDGMAGGKTVLVERVEWRVIDDPNAAANALATGQVDIVESPGIDLRPVLERSPNVRFTLLNPVGQMLYLRPNTLQPPFDKVEARQALLHLVDQREVLQALGVPEADTYPYCPAYFFCGTPLETRAGAAGLQQPDIPRAKALLAKAGYAGQKVMIMQPADQPLVSAATLVVVQALRRGGIAAEPALMDWGSLLVRRAKTEGPEAGGWNLFITQGLPFDATDPVVHSYLAMPCPNPVPGFPCDPGGDLGMEGLRRAWWQSQDPAKRRALVDAIQERAYDQVPYVNAGQYRTPSAHRVTVTGLRPAVGMVFWGVGKE